MSGKSLFKKFLDFAKRRTSTQSTSSSQSNTMISQEHDYVNEVEEKIYPIQILEDAVSTLHKCKTTQASKLCVFDISRKLEVNSVYDIGGTYDKDGLPEFWFYYTTTTLPGYSYLFNLFVCHRKVGNISLDLQELTYEKEDDGVTSVYNMSSSPLTVTFQSFEANQHYFVKTFSFNVQDLDNLKQSYFYIHLCINFNSKSILNKNNINHIKLSHLTSNIFKDEKTDFTLVTSSGKKYPVHKIILAAHSSVLGDVVKNATSPTVTVDVSGDIMESVVQFLYTGTVKDILKKDCQKICEAAEKLGIDGLVHLAKISLRELAGGV